MGKHRGRSVEPAGGTSRRWWLVALAVLVVAGAAGLGWLARAPSQRMAAVEPALSPGSGAQAAALRETRPTLDPALFVGKAALTHRIAREIPEVLDQLYCYCYCDKHMGHKSLLSCYTDGHAAT